MPLARAFPASACVLFFVLAALLVAGCNAYGSFEREGASSDPEALLVDAQAALQRQEPEKAVRYLRRALDLAPDHPRVRIKLATALLAVRDLDALDFAALARAFVPKAAFAREAPPADPRLASVTALHADAADAYCNFPASHPHTEFDPTRVESYDKLTASEATLQEIQVLIDRVLTGEETSPGGSAEEPVEDYAERLRAQGLSDAEIAEALLNDAVAYGTLAYLDIAEAGGEAITFYHVAPPGEARYIDYCAPSRALVDEVLEVVACHLPEADYARRLARARANLLGSGTAAELADLADDGYARLERNLEVTCPVTD